MVAIALPRWATGGGRSYGSARAMGEATARADVDQGRAIRPVTPRPAAPPPAPRGGRRPHRTGTPAPPRSAAQRPAPASVPAASPPTGPRAAPPARDPTPPPT